MAIIIEPFLVVRQSWPEGTPREKSPRCYALFSCSLEFMNSAWRHQNAGGRETRSQDELTRVGSPPLLGAALAVLILHAVGLSVGNSADLILVSSSLPGSKSTATAPVGCYVSIPPFAVTFALLSRLLPAPHRDVFLIGALAGWTGPAHPDKRAPPPSCQLQGTAR